MNTFPTLSLHIIGWFTRPPKISPFEVVYGFNPLTPLDVIPLPNPRNFIHKEGISRSEFVKKMHDNVKSQIQHQTERYTKQNNKEKGN